MVLSSGTCGKKTTSGFVGWTVSVEKYHAPLAQRRAGIDELPRRTAVVAAKQAAFFRLDHGIDAARVGWGDGETDFAPDAFGQTVGEFLAFGGVLAGVGAVVGRRGDEVRPRVAAVP